MAGVLVEPEPENITISTHIVLPVDEESPYSMCQEKLTKCWQKSVANGKPHASVVKKRNRRRHKKKCNQQSVNAPLGPSITIKRVNVLEKMADATTLSGDSKVVDLVKDTTVVKRKRGRQRKGCQKPLHPDTHVERLRGRPRKGWQGSTKSHLGRYVTENSFPAEEDGLNEWKIISRTKHNSENENLPEKVVLSRKFPLLNKCGSQLKNIKHNTNILKAKAHSIKNMNSPSTKNSFNASNNTSNITEICNKKKENCIVFGENNTLDVSGFDNIGMFAGSSTGEEFEKFLMKHKQDLGANPNTSKKCSNKRKYRRSKNNTATEEYNSGGCEKKKEGINAIKDKHRHTEIIKVIETQDKANSHTLECESNSASDSVDNELHAADTDDSNDLLQMYLDNEEDISAYLQDFESQRDSADDLQLLEQNFSDIRISEKEQNEFGIASDVVDTSLNRLDETQTNTFTVQNSPSICSEYSSFDAFSATKCDEDFLTMKRDEACLKSNREIRMKSEYISLDEFMKEHTCSEKTVKRKSQRPDRLIIDLTGSDSECESSTSSARLCHAHTIAEEPVAELKDSPPIKEEFELEIVDVLSPQTPYKQPFTLDEKIRCSRISKKSDIDKVCSQAENQNISPRKVFHQQKCDLKILDQKAVNYPAAYVTDICNVLAKYSKECCPSLQNSLNVEKEKGPECITAVVKTPVVDTAKIDRKNKQMSSDKILNGCLTKASKRYLPIFENNVCLNVKKQKRFENVTAPARSLVDTYFLRGRDSCALPVKELRLHEVACLEPGVQPPDINCIDLSCLEDQQILNSGTHVNSLVETINYECENYKRIVGTRQNVEATLKFMEDRAAKKLTTLCSVLNTCSETSFFSNATLYRPVKGNLKNEGNSQMGNSSGMNSGLMLAPHSPTHQNDVKSNSKEANS